MSIWKSGEKGPDAGQTLVLRALLKFNSMRKEERAVSRKTLGLEVARQAKRYNQPVWLAGKARLSRALMELKKLGLVETTMTRPCFSRINPKRVTIAKAVVSTYNLYASMKLPEVERNEWLRVTSPSDLAV